MKSDIIAILFTCKATPSNKYLPLKHPKLDPTISTGGFKNY